VAGCGAQPPAQPTTPSVAATAQATTPPAEPTPSATPTSRAVDTALDASEGGWSWSGGALVGYPAGNRLGGDAGETTFDLWLPGMAQPRTCVVSPLLSGEHSAGGPFAVVASTDGHPKVAIAYAAVTDAVGLTPQSTHMYVQPVDDCTLGTRVDLGVPSTADVPAGAGARVLAVDGAVVVVAGTGLFGYLPGDLIAVDLAAGKIAWSQFDNDPDRDPTRLGDHSVHVWKACSQRRSEDNYCTHRDEAVVDVVTGRATPLAVESLPGAYSRTWQLSPATAVVENGLPPGAIADHRAANFFLYSSGAISPVPDTVTSASDGGSAGGFTGLSSMVMPDGTTTIVAMNGSDRLAYLGQDGALHQILTPQQMDQLSIKVLGAGGGSLYVTTTSQHLTVGLDGHESGTWRRWYPDKDGDRQLGGVLYTLWVDGSDHYALTSGGSQPAAA
jgi:hypothetical protein